MKKGSGRLKEIPSVSLESFDVRTVRTVGRAFEDIGFVFVHAPGIAKMLASNYAEYETFFNLPASEKIKYARPDIGYQRGYTPLYTEKALACRKKGPGKTDVGDMKENWFMGPEKLTDPTLVERYPEIYYPNIWPEEVPKLAHKMQALYETLFHYGQETLRAIALYLNKPSDYFDVMLQDAPTVLRAIHYPPVSAEQVGKVTWGCRHTDINFATVLPPSSRSGLWIKRRDGEWIPGAAPKGYVIVQVADMLRYLTAGQFISAVHEVRAPESATTEGRFSAALFMHARSDVVFDPQNKKFPAITAGDLLRQRLKAIGLLA